jgi:PST family polysaccharide transporter
LPGAEAEQWMTEQQQAGGRKDLGKVALVGSALQMAGRGMRSLVGVATVAVLARFLAPADLGAFALIAAIVMLAQVFADLGLRVALVQKPEITDLECQSVFWVSTAAGALLTVLMIALADPIAALFQEPTLAPYIMAVAPFFLIVGTRGVPIALLERRFMFKEIAATEFAAAVVGSITAILFAVSGAKVGALVAQQVAMVTVLAILLFYFARWKPRFQFSKAALKPLAGYGSFVTLSGVVFAAGPLIERPLIATRLSPADLGYLSMGEQIILSPVRTIAQNVTRVTFPLFASFQDDNSRIVQAHRSSLHALALAVAPCVLGIAALAEPLSILLLGPAWAPVASILAIVALWALASSISEMNYAVFKSKGKARFQFNWTLLTLGIGIAVLFITLPFGIEAVAAGRLVTALVLLPVYSWLLARLLGTTNGAILSPVVRPVLAAILMAAAVHGLDRALEAQGVAMLGRAAAGIAAGVPLYLLMVLAIDRRQALALVDRIRSARRKG